MLCAGGGTLGSVDLGPVPLPWWPEAAGVVRAARERLGTDVILLRLLCGRTPNRPPRGGAVTYLAELGDPSQRLRRPVAPWRGRDPLTPHPLRLPWAEPGGPAADLAWARGVLRARGTPPCGPARQVKTWNLSSLWTLPTDDGSVWLKAVPPFFSHEASVIARLGGPVPELLAADGPRMLLAHLPGTDQFDAPRERLLAMVDILVALQSAQAGRVPELLGLGMPDWRGRALVEAAAPVLRHQAAALDREDVMALGTALDEGMTGRLRAIEEAGLPETLVHGDFHPGNVRGGEDRLTLLDWGDCGVGHPLLDQAAFLSRIPAEDREPVSRHWAGTWRRAVPGCDPETAARLLRPLAALRQAVVYQGFLDRIEPDERVYHAQDPAAWLRVAAESLRA